MAKSGGGHPIDPPAPAAFARAHEARTSAPNESWITPSTGRPPAGALRDVPASRLDARCPSRAQRGKRMNKGTAIVGFLLCFIAGMGLMWGVDRSGAGQCEVAFARQQTLAGEMHGDQGG